MSFADVLYGITMPEPGVSKRIAIKFEEIEKHLPMDEIDRAAASAREAAAAPPATPVPGDSAASQPAEPRPEPISESIPEPLPEAQPEQPAKEETPVEEVAAPAAAGQ